ncbi:hypothetical protein CONCODRAFT_5287 [Conidiobolus coronatus NRRL 28638]|uniref:ATP synthase F(0) complex subunit e, mitochondrial n=1 Tax=Conidiobolus coronatus (strain ATCC 28846 / CBS 209.66 / NRRL 28638) TaxID=796925 RepID=A0A137PAC2_CONC2|nr:hypothetical protein CONCODRAFT_5287 [Conidiobolus coronatus NRRL 28638]|eukprot:KXN71959.1 hypothetical protein CONCODRAFT_5287 [Conidiobolus coronatus NRRL 28638]
MTTPLVSFLRWGAFGTGIVYGFTRHNKLVKLEADLAAKKEFQRKEDLIKQAKAAYAATKVIQSKSNDVISDPEDPKFDLEAYLLSFEKN